VFSLWRLSTSLRGPVELLVLAGQRRRVTVDSTARTSLQLDVGGVRVVSRSVDAAGPSAAVTRGACKKFPATGATNGVLDRLSSSARLTRRCHRAPSDARAAGPSRRTATTARHHHSGVTPRCQRPPHWPARRREAHPLHQVGGTSSGSTPTRSPPGSTTTAGAPAELVERHAPSDDRRVGEAILKLFLH
jgi:hypothetical protein